jgi:hypothetical protein
LNLDRLSRRWRSSRTSGRGSGGSSGRGSGGPGGRSSRGSCGRLGGGGSGGSSGRGSGRRARRRASLVDSRSRNDIAGDALVDAEQHSGVSVLVVTRESNTRGVGSTRSRDGELNTSYVWLYSIDIIGTMKSNNLTTEQVVSRGDISRNSDVNTSFVIKQPINTPSSINQTVLIDFEPYIARTSLRFSQVHHDGTLVGGLDDVIRR